MIEHPPQTEPLPPPDTAAGLAHPDILTADNSRPLSEQVDDFVAAQGRDAYEGLTYVEDGKVHVVRRSDQIRRDQDTSGDPEAHDKVGPVIHRKGPKTRPLYFYREKDPHKPTIDTDLLSIDVYEDGRLAYVKYADQAAFGSNLDRYGASGGLFWLQEKEPNPPRDRIIDVNVPTSPKQSVFESVISTKEQNELPDLSGLTYDHNGQTIQVIREVTTQMQDHNGWHPTHLVEIAVFEGGTGVAKRLIKIDGFKKELDGISQANRGLLNMHFEVERPSRSLQQDRMVGQLALDKRMRDPDTYTKFGLEPSGAEELLRYPDLDGKISGSMLADMRERLESDPNFDEIAETLGLLYAELDPDKLIELADRLKNNYVEDIRTLGLEPQPEDRSITPMLWDLAKQRWLADNPDRVTIQDRGLEEGKASGFTHDYRSKQNELVDRRVGEAFDRKAAQRIQVPQETLAKQPDGSFGRVIEIGISVVIHEEFMVTIPNAFRPKIREILSAITPENPVLPYEEQVKLGRLVRRSVGR